MYAIQLYCLFDEIRIIFEPLMIAIFQLCLLPKMRLSVDHEGRFTGYRFLVSNLHKNFLCIAYNQELFLQNGRIECQFFKLNFFRIKNSSLPLYFSVQQSIQQAMRAYCPKYYIYSATTIVYIQHTPSNKICRP